jgi:hypothetical protein
MLNSKPSCNPITRIRITKRMLRLPHTPARMQVIRMVAAFVRIHARGMIRCMDITKGIGV